MLYVICTSWCCLNLHYSDTHRRTDGQMDSVGLHSFAVEIFEIAEVVIGSWLKR